MRALVYSWCLLLGLGVAAQPLSAQGCSQCRDTVSQTSPGVQASYRTAILVMIAAVTGLVGSITLVFRRMR